MAGIIDWDQHIGGRLKLRDLHVFFVAAQCGSMAKAATRLRVTQPAVSQVIADLEHVLGVKLFDRSPRGVEPTRFGHALLKGAGIAFDELKQTIRELEFLADPSVGEVKVGCPEVVAVLLPPIIQRLTESHPGVVVHTSDVSAPTLDVPQVRDRSLDLAILRIAGPPSLLQFDDDLKVEVLFNDETVVVAGRDSRWSRRRKIEIAELADEPWILPPPETLNTKVVVDAFRAVGLNPPRISVVTFSVQLRLNMLADGPYVSVLPRSMMRLYGFRLPVKVLPVKLPDREWSVAMVTLKNRTSNPITNLFIEHLRLGVRSFADR
jgi:DNA-binding transcriptional LysR family regulator